MKIGIDISQLAYQNTGVSNYLENLVIELVQSKHEFILFFSSLRRDLPVRIANLSTRDNVKIKKFKIPPTMLDTLWNKLHILPIETFIGSVDVFITSDWTEPPTKAKKMTILYDLIIFTYPTETDSKIISVQKRKLTWVKKESSKIFCISEATKKDAGKILGIDSAKLSVIYPGLTL